jgi:acyl dehydratase
MDELHRKGLYFEEYQVGQKVVSAGRTITDADIVNFAGFSGDYTQIHVNAETSRQGMFGQRIAHGLGVLSITSGLIAQFGFFEGTVLALRELTCKFSRPVFIGDTIHAVAEVIEKKEMPRLGGGSVTFDVQAINQEDKVVQHGEWVLLFASQEADKED